MRFIDMKNLDIFTLGITCVALNKYFSGRIVFHMVSRKIKNKTMIAQYLLPGHSFQSKDYKKSQNINEPEASGSDPEEQTPPSKLTTNKKNVGSHLNSIYACSI